MSAYASSTHTSSTHALATIDVSKITDTTPIQIGTTSGDLQMSVDDVLRLIAPNAPRKDALRFLMACRAAGANPLLGEAELVPFKDKWGTIFTKATYLKRARKTGEYDGHEGGITIRLYDPVAKQYQGDLIDREGTIQPVGYAIVGGWARVYRKDTRVPTYKQLSLVEYDKQLGTWVTIKATMIAKVALVHALREAFDFSEGYDQAEADPSSLIPIHPSLGVSPSIIPGKMTQLPPATDADYEGVDEPSLDPILLTRLNDLCVRIGMTDEQYATMLSRRNVNHAHEMSNREAVEIIHKLEEMFPASPDNFGNPRPETLPATVPAMVAVQAEAGQLMTA